MKDRRWVDELTIEELEEILRLKRREERLKRLRERGAARASQAETRTPRPLDLPRPAEGGTQYSAVIESPRRARPRRGIRWGWIWDRFLLLIEVLALLGFLLVVLQMSLTLQTLNQESRAAQSQPTPTPTPVIGVGILPGGHTPPDAQGQTQPAPIPPHLRALIAEVTPLPVPTPGPEQARRIVIPAIGVDAPVVEGDDWESLKKGAGHHIGSANPGERGNCVISAHDDVYGEIFRDLPKVQVGDEVRLYTETQVYRYTVVQSRIIAPDEIGVMAPTHSPVLTLISCYPYGVDTHRIVVIATLQS